MSETKIESLDADLLPYVESEKSNLGDIPDEVRARLVAGVRARLTAGGGQGGDGGASQARGRGGPARRLVRAYPIQSVMVAMGVGALLGALARGAWLGETREGPKERIVYVEHQAPAVSDPVIVAPAAPPAESATPAPVASAPPSRVSIESSVHETAERVILDAARGALLSGDPGAAWDAIQRHEHKFPRGALAEERDALAVRALVALGRERDARDRAALLRRRSPRSVFLPAAESALTALAADAGTP